MNIFDVVGGNKGLQEDHVTAVLGWLLDPSQSHGCGTLFLLRFLNLVDLESKSKLIGQNVVLAKGRQHGVSVNVVIEFPVSSYAGDRFIDVVIIISEEKKTNIIAIENKIRSSSAKKEQLVEQYDGLRKEFPQSDISMVYITPQKKSVTNSAFEQLNGKDFLKRHIEWDSCHDKTFKTLLSSILEEEGIGKVPPMSYETKFVLKSFIQFIFNDFRLPSFKSKVPSSILRIDGLVKGLNELKQTYEDKKVFYVGFAGGVKALKASSFNYLESRPYKYLFSLEGGSYNKNNWILAEDFFESLPNKDN